MSSFSAYISMLFGTSCKANKCIVCWERNKDNDTIQSSYKMIATWVYFNAQNRCSIERACGLAFRNRQPKKKELIYINMQIKKVAQCNFKNALRSTKWSAKRGGDPECWLQKWASTLAKKSNARHRSNIRAPPRLPPQMYVSKVWESVWPEGAGRDS